MIWTIQPRIWNHNYWPACAKKKTTIRKSLWEKHKDLTFSKHQNNKKDKENVGTCSLWTTYYIIQFNFDSRRAPHQPIIMYIIEEHFALIFDALFTFFTF